MSRRSASPRTRAQSLPGTNDVPAGVVDLGAGPAGAPPHTATAAVELGAAAPGAPLHPVPHTVHELHVELDEALVRADAVNATVGPRIEEANARLAAQLVAALNPELARIHQRIGAVEALAGAQHAAAPALEPNAIPFAPFGALPEVFSGAQPMPLITAPFGAWSDADGWLRAAALGQMAEVASAFMAAVQPALHPGQLVALRAMTRAAIECAAEAGRLGIQAGTFAPLLRPQVVAALSYATAMARTNGGSVHPAFAASAVDELMSLPQWTTRAADARLREVHERLRLFQAGASHRPASAPEQASKGRKGRGGRGGKQTPASN